MLDTQQQASNPLNYWVESTMIIKHLDNLVSNNVLNQV